jgi:hypothetical protein
VKVVIGWKSSSQGDGRQGRSSQEGVMPVKLISRIKSPKEEENSQSLEVSSNQFLTTDGIKSKAL